MEAMILDKIPVLLMGIGLGMMIAGSLLRLAPREKPEPAYQGLGCATHIVVTKTMDTNAWVVTFLTRAGHDRPDDAVPWSVWAVSGEEGIPVAIRTVTPY